MYSDKPDLVRRIREAMEDERHDAAFYAILIEMAPPEDKDIIKGIREDELKHYTMFSDMYTYLTGSSISVPEPEISPPKSYKDGLASAIMGETSAVEEYRIILIEAPFWYMKNWIYIIVTDEQKHADRFNMLYSRA
jgi:rubrerythrin